MLKAPQRNQSEGSAVPKRATRPPFKRRAHSNSPSASPYAAKAKVYASQKPPERRCHSLSPSLEKTKTVLEEQPSLTLSCQSSTSEARNFDDTNNNGHERNLSNENSKIVAEKDPVLPHCMVMKIMRALATKKRMFAKMHKTVISQQNAFMEQYSSIKEMEARVGIQDESMGEIRIISVRGWPAHDLLLLVRDDLELPRSMDIRGPLGLQILQQLHSQLNPIPENVLNMSAEIMARRIDILNLLKGKIRTDRTNLEWKTKNAAFDQETEDLQRMVAGTVENLKAKLTFSLNLAKIAWLDRETLINKIEKLQKEILLLQNKMGETNKKEQEDSTEVQNNIDITQKFEVVCDELAKEKAAREALKDVVTSAESMLRVARARLATLERQLKENKAELEASRKKQKDLEQLYRHRESSYDARSKKLMEMSKNGEQAIETLSRQRDALEIRVKELREQAENAEKQAEIRETERKARMEALQLRVTEQEKNKKAAEMHILELEVKLKQLDDQCQAMRDCSAKLVETERNQCLEFLPSKECEPSDRETEIWKELQETRVAMARAEEELRQSRADKDNFLNSLTRIAQGEDEETHKSQMATELLEREQKIIKLQNAIEEQRNCEKSMEQRLKQYESQISALRFEVKRLRNYDCYCKDTPYQDLQTELVELHLQVETLARERSALVTAAASRALMLERNERASELFARMTRVRRELAAVVDGRTEPPAMEDGGYAEASRSLSSVCINAADTWSALRAERARVLSLESAVLAQNLQLEREGRVRTQLERRRAMLERELLRAQHSTPAVDNPRFNNMKSTIDRSRYC